MTSSGRALDRIALASLVVVIRSPTAEDALHVSRALLGAGVEVIEVTYTTPDATAVIKTLRNEVGDHVLIGAGTIRSASDAQQAVDAGADFLVSPGSPPRLVESMLATDRLVLPGVLTPTEIMLARSLGVTAVKLFPANMVGPAGLRALCGPFPDVAFVPTGGVTAGDARTWLDAGALAVGIGGTLAPPSLSGDVEVSELTARARRALADVRAARR